MLGSVIPIFFIEKSNTLGEKNMTVNMDAAICFKLESELKDFLEDMATSKDMSLSAYCRYVIGVGLNELYKRNYKKVANASVARMSE